MNKIIYETKKHENYFIYEKELRALLHNLKKKAFEYNGILYGDIVINSIISKYYKDKFLENNAISNFWNIKINSETSARTITSNNFEVYFKIFNDYLKFLNYIKTNNKFKIIENKSLNSDLFIHNKYILNTNIGKTITWNGIELNINLNITSKIPKEKNIEPPFFEPYFTTDLLIMTNDGNGPRFSKNTGLKYIDNMNIIDKNELFAKIIKDICYFKTYIISNNDYANNYIAHKCIEYIDKGWDILNLPFKIENFNNNEIITCYICLEEIIKNDSIGKFEKSKNCILHTKCLLKYLKNKLDSDAELVCPFRQEINFVNKDFILLNYKQL